MFRNFSSKRAASGDLVYADSNSPEAASGSGGKGKRRLAAAVIALCVAVTAALGVMTIGILVRRREDRYTAALALVQEKAYQEAAAAFGELGDYRDSRNQVQRLQEQQAAYDAALELLHQQRYEEAQAAFRALGDYADSAVMAAYHVTYQKALALKAEIDIGKTQLLTRILTDQVKLTDERSYPTIVGYETAAAMLESLGDYRSAADLVDRCYYSAGLVRLGWEDWAGALSYMEKMSGETAAQFYEEYQQYYAEKTGGEGQ